MKKWIVMVMVLAAGMVSFAQEWTVITGKVIKARSGTSTVFYTLQDKNTGKRYEANSSVSAIALNEELFKKALETGCELTVECSLMQKFPNSIHKINAIELKPVSPGK